MLALAGDAHKAAALRARSFELQASAKSWAAELADDTNPVHIVGRSGSRCSTSLAMKLLLDQVQAFRHQAC